MDRKIIQIAVTEVPGTNRAQGSMTIHALCDDGTLWSKSSGVNHWFQIDISVIKETK